MNMVVVFINSLPYFFEVNELKGSFCVFYLVLEMLCDIYISFFLPRSELTMSRETFLKCTVCLLYLPLEESLVFSVFCCCFLNLTASIDDF